MENIDLINSVTIPLFKLEVNKGQIDGLPANPRFIKDERYKKLVKSIQENPEMLALRELLVYKQNEKYIIVGGNMRYRALKELGYKETICKIIPPETTIEALKAITIKDNAGFGEWDFDMLANEWNVDDLQNWCVEIPNIDDLLNEKKEVEEDDFEITESVETDIVDGDIIEIGNHRLICGDSTLISNFEKVLNGRKIDCVFTSPPYNMGIIKPNPDFGGIKKQMYLNKHQDNKTKIEYKHFLLTVLKNIHYNLSEKNAVFWNVSYNSNSRDDYGKIIFSDENPLKVQETIIWNKMHPFTFASSNILTRQCELVFLLATNNDYITNQNISCYVNVWNINVDNNTQQENHKACFPVKLPAKAITDFTKENHLIFDCFMGSGTTMLAAEQLNRTCYGIEKEPVYCEMIIQRMKSFNTDLQIKVNGILRD